MKIVMFSAVPMSAKLIKYTANEVEEIKIAKKKEGMADSIAFIEQFANENGLELVNVSPSNIGYDFFLTNK